MGATWLGKTPYQLTEDDTSIASWMLDNVVTWFGITIENALSERVKSVVGANVEYKPRYTLALLLSDGFRLYRPQEQQQSSNPFAPLLAWAGKRNSGVKIWKYVPPVEKEQ